MKKQHILIIIIAGITIVLMASCKKFLEVTPKHAIPDETAIIDKKSAEQALRGVYRAAGQYKQSYTILNVLAGGDATWNNVGDPHLIIAHDYRADNANLESVWNNVYRAINQANLVIEKVPTLEDQQLTQEDRNRLLGEALFFRAMGYFDLVRIWGGVPLKLTPTDNLNKPLDLPRSSREQTYARVSEDLEQARTLLPETHAVNRIRVSREAVQALLSRVYLYEKNWQQAEQSATFLITHPNYALTAPFSSWFKTDGGTRESILEIAYSAQNPNGLRNDMQHQTKGGSYSLAPKAATAQLLNDPAYSGGAEGRSALVGSLTQAGTTVWYGNLYFRSPATDPLYVLRIAEQYLIRAEARIYNEDLESALADINAIRARAGLTPYTHDNYDIDNPEALLLAIENERRFEFLWEGDRWPDLVRTGRAATLFNLEPYKLLFPIPLNEVVIGKLDQNPQYN
jgi:SusD family.